MPFLVHVQTDGRQDSGMKIIRNGEYLSGGYEKDVFFLHTSRGILDSYLLLFSHVTGC